MNTQRPKQLMFFFAVVVVTVVLSSCQWEPNYPSQLTEADSLLMCGDYERMDSLLAVYDRISTSRKESSRNYRQLLQLGRQFVAEALTNDDFSLADSLCRYYERHGSRDKYGKALCFLGSIYQVSGDYPSSLAAYLKGSKVSDVCGDSRLSGWFCRCLGDLYFEQRMLDECIGYYRKYFRLAVAHRDTLRMSMSSFSMGRVYTIKNSVDSIIYYYEKAIEYGSHTKHPEHIVPYARYQLGDIYTQLEEYDKAKRYMSYDSLNAPNWAYWHLGQHHLDSAIWYFEKTRDCQSLLGQAEACLNLAQLEEGKGNTTKALSYYKCLLAVEDSLKQKSQVEESRRISAQYNLNLIKKERDEVAGRNHLMAVTLSVLVGLVIAGIILGYYIWEYYRQKRDKELAHERLLRQLEEEKNYQSVSRIEQNERIIAQLEEQLADARRQDDFETAARLELDTEQLKTQNQNIEARQRLHQYLLDEFQKSALYIKVKKHSGDEKFHLTDEEWERLATDIDKVYSNFTQRLFMLVQLSDVELKTCYLIKLKVAPADIATMLYKSKTAITMLRQRLYEKITQKKGTAKQLDTFILDF